MISIIDETEEVSTDLLDTLLACVKNENKVMVSSYHKLILSLLSVNLGFDLSSLT